MLDDVFVLDAITHAYNFRPDNRLGGEYADGIIRGVYGAHEPYSPPGRKDLVLTEDVFINQICDPDVTGQMLFGESHTDVCIYHELPLFGYFKDGGSPLSVGKAMRERWPERVYLYGGISPHQPGALERVDQLVEEDKVVGLKLYPHDLVEGELRAFSMNDPDLLFPIFERAQKHGLKTVAIHKAMVMGPVPVEPYSPNDVVEAARAFPDLTFEIVHGGWAFLEETAVMMQWFPNITASLEGTSAFLFRAPRKFAEIIGTLLLAGAADRLLWAIGGAVVHSRAFEEAFWQFEMPQDLVDGYGFPPLTDEVKRGILGGNAARMLGIDVRDFQSKTEGDEFAKPRQLAKEWTCLGGASATLAGTPQEG